MKALNQTQNSNSTPGTSSRKDGIASFAEMLSNALSGSNEFTTNPNALTELTDEPQVTNTDVLVIGGGMSGAFAAVTAKEQGLEVTLVDKGTVGRSGSTPWANGFAVFDEDRNSREEWISGVCASSEYVNNLDWLEQVMDDSKSRWDDMVDWGMLGNDILHPSLGLRDKLLEVEVSLIERTMLTTLLVDDDGRVIGAMGFSLDTEETIVVLAKTTIMCAGAGSFKAPGFPVHSLTSDGDAMAYRAGAIISGKEFVDFHFTFTDTPAACWKQWAQMWTTIRQTNTVFTSGMTLSSAYTAHEGGATVTDGDTSQGMGMQGEAPEGEPPEDGGGPGGERPEGEDSQAERPEGDDAQAERPEEAPSDDEGAGGERPEGGEGGGGEPPEGGEGGGGEPPEGGEGGGGGGGGPDLTGGTYVLGAATGLGIHKAEGVWPTNLVGACNVPGLFAAGDALASMVCGSSYAGPGLSLSASAVQGAVVGKGAAEDALLQEEQPTLSEDAIANYQSDMLAPRLRTTGFTPAWVTQVLQNTMFPYYILMVKEQNRMNAALSTVTFLKEHMVPFLTAQDAHELKLAHETENMILNAEMKLRSAMFRTESRGTHFREDYPARDDDNWLAWVLLSKDANGNMTVTKQEIPDEWKPDLSIPYVERYTTRFPGELEYLGLE